MQPAANAVRLAGLALSMPLQITLAYMQTTGSMCAGLAGCARRCPHVPTMLRPCLELLQVLQKARQKLQKVAKEGMAAAIVKQDHAGVLRFSALFPPLGYQVCGPSRQQAMLGPFTLHTTLGGLQRVPSSNACRVWCASVLKVLRLCAG